MKEKKNKIVRGIKGKRLVIVHAITKDGWLRKAGSELQNPVSFLDKKEVFDCEMVFDAAHEEGDYHKNMDSDKFMYWVETRLFPTAKKLYPNRGVCLVLFFFFFGKKI